MQTWEKLLESFFSYMKRCETDVFYLNIELHLSLALIITLMVVKHIVYAGSSLNHQGAVVESKYTTHLSISLVCYFSKYSEYYFVHLYVRHVSTT